MNSGLVIGGETTDRRSIASESNDVGPGIQFLLYGKRHHAYRISPSKRVNLAVGPFRVFHVRHGAMKQLLADDLKVLRRPSFL
jgi:hypothetical protein